jgi:hypothetical protein
LYSSGGRSFNHRRAALLAEVPIQIQRPFAETADHRTRLGDLPRKRFFQSFVVEFQSLIAEAGAQVLRGRSNTRSQHGGGSDF